MKYNIALIPSDAIVSNALTVLAQEISIERGMTPQYLLRNGISHPHVSVIQFEIVESPFWGSKITSPEHEIFLGRIWETVLRTFDEIKSGDTSILCIPSCRINYKHDSSGIFAGISWSEILIDKLMHPRIQEFHVRLLQRLVPHQIICMNANGDRYNPHFTLFNIQTSLLRPEALVHEMPHRYQLALQNIRLRPVLGIANDQWELVQLKHTS